MVVNNLMGNFDAGHTLILGSLDKLMYLRGEKVSLSSFLLSNVTQLQYMFRENA